jgi:hypothetical protein
MKKKKKKKRIGKGKREISEVKYLWNVAGNALKVKLEIN